MKEEEEKDHVTLDFNQSAYTHEIQLLEINETEEEDEEEKREDHCDLFSQMNSHTSSNLKSNIQLFFI